ncbi:MAG: hypothetical protein JWO72_2335, partial [Caulobacteraceae bacterium]|nr:hypothetical protein [Caulobacteraceae bacterium]
MNAARQSTSPAVLKTVALLLLLLTLYVWDRVVLAVSLPEIRTALDLTARQTGLIASAFAAGVALVALPSGLLVRRVGFKPVLLCGALIFSLATAYPPWAHGFWDLLASRLLVGLGEGLFNVSLILYLGGVSTHHRATWVGLAATVFGVAASVGPPLIHFVDGAFGGWQVSFYVLAVLGGLLSFCLAILDPAALAKRSEPSRGDVGPSSVTRLLGFWPLLVLVGVVGLSLYSVTGLLPAWTREHFGFTAASADLALGAVGVGLLLGGAPMGLIADRFDRRSYALAIAIVCFLSVSAHMALNVGPIYAVVLGALCGMVPTS